MTEPGVLWGEHTVGVSQGGQAMSGTLGNLHSKAWVYTGLVEVAAHRSLTSPA